MDDHQYDDSSDSLSLPRDSVVGVVNEPDEATSAVEDLIARGIAEDDIHMLCCDSGAHRLDPSGERHGTLGRIQRVIQLFGDKEVEHLQRQAAELRKGHFLIAAPAENDEERDLVAEVLKSHGGHFINHYTDWTISSLEE